MVASGKGFAAGAPEKDCTDKEFIVRQADQVSYFQGGLEPKLDIRKGTRTQAVVGAEAACSPYYGYRNNLKQ